MRIAVIGAGAVGCYVGGLLAHAGHNVTLLGRAVHVDAIKANGLLLDMPDGSRRIEVDAVTDAADLSPADLVLVCVKSADTEDAGRELLPILREGTVILSLQNGVDNAEKLRTVTGHSVVPAVVYVAVDMKGPGHVGYHGGGRLLIGSCPESEAIASAFTQAGVPTIISERVLNALWTKLTINCAYNALSAVAQIAYTPMLEVEGVKAVMAQVVQECQDVAAACQVWLPETMLQQVLDIAKLMPDQKSSTAQDIKRGRPTEIDYLNGYIVRKGAEFGIATPTNQALQVMVKLAEKSHCHVER
ncbi:ketopantoate reductase family protein [Acetobacter tropicalis]|uniref:2-dehydropantoate 2-reductase n=1 Tax=Acetobacter tropicalis NBRC 101654 TaxID=749388 RepID=F7VF42_9PROT|nr:MULTISPECIES: 2-dehydropantoate 2-reductase [Acetobacter]MCG4253294.1 2-dehydropantoate 2-reductase [Acetobacter senegalensis]GAA08987.1 ketopantoate reductase ApbA/PanE [Acetobacter tropicalis NBRC 101654]